MGGEKRKIKEEKMKKLRDSQCELIKAEINNKYFLENRTRHPPSQSESLALSSPTPTGYSVMQEAEHHRQPLSGQSLAAHPWEPQRDYLYPSSPPKKKSIKERTKNYLSKGKQGWLL